MKRISKTVERKMKKMMKQEGRTLPEYMLHWPYIMAIVPYYDEHANDCTMIYYVNGVQRPYSCACEQILEDLALVFRTSLDVVRGRASVLADKSRWGKMRKIPFAMIVDFVLVPMKFRVPNQRNSGTLGYVVYHYIERIEKTAENRCRTLFKDGQLKLDILQQYRGIQYQMELAEYLNRLTRVEDEYWRYEICNAKKVVKPIIQKNRKSGR